MIIRQYQIEKTLAYAIAYSDETALSRQESIKLDDWCMDQLEPYYSAHYGSKAFFVVDMDTIDDVDNFKLCDVTRKLSDCCTVYLMRGRIL